LDFAVIGVCPFVFHSYCLLPFCRQKFLCSYFVLTVLFIAKSCCCQFRCRSPFVGNRDKETDRYICSLVLSFSFDSKTESPPMFIAPFRPFDLSVDQAYQPLETQIYIYLSN
jgi:hypothetical protein